MSRFRQALINGAKAKGMTLLDTCQLVGEQLGHPTRSARWRVYNVLRAFPGSGRLPDVDVVLGFATMLGLDPSSLQGHALEDHLAAASYADPWRIESAARQALPELAAAVQVELDRVLRLPFFLRDWPVEEREAHALAGARMFVGTRHARRWEHEWVVCDLDFTAFALVTFFWDDMPPGLDEESVRIRTELGRRLEEEGMRQLQEDPGFLRERMAGLVEPGGRGLNISPAWSTANARRGAWCSLRAALHLADSAGVPPGDREDLERREIDFATMNGVLPDPREPLWEGRWNREETAG